MRTTVYIISLFTLVYSTTSSALPKKFLTQRSEQPIEEYQGPFSLEEIRTKDYINIKFAEWRACHQDRVQNSVGPYSHNNEAVLEFLGQSRVINNILILEQNGLTSAALNETPWSGDYWPIAKGILGSRPFAKQFNMLETWLERFEFIQKFSPDKQLKERGASSLAELAVSEKFELLIGEKNFRLSKAMWQEGKKYYDHDGKVEEWMGICHGWAPASYMRPRPTQKIILPSYDKQWDIPLYPDEIKGLISYVWGYNKYPVRFIGERCNLKNPSRRECQDINPATWHLVVTNRLGQQKKSFVMDATYDYEVWNQPVFAYEYTYFNPQTGKLVSQINDAIVQTEDFANDRYKKNRSKEATQIIGIKMRVGYAVEVQARANDRDQASLDAVHWVEYRYDLELNPKFEIVGGEWYQQAHPDFLWAPVDEARPLSAWDRTLPQLEWNNHEPVPERWALAARDASVYGTLINTIIEKLLSFSNP